MTRRSSRRPAGRATDREVGVVAAVLVAGSEKAAAHRLGLSHSTVKHHLANARSKVGAETTAQLVWILAARLPEPEDMARKEERQTLIPGSPSTLEAPDVAPQGGGSPLIRSARPDAAQAMEARAPASPRPPRRR
jgi:DNA-binding CsgD family transcriptional regulator